MPPSLQEIAKLAGVSPAAVSAVRNGTEGIRLSVETRSRISSLLRENKITFNRRKNGRFSKNRQVVFFPSKNLSEPFQHNVLQGICERLDEDGARLVYSPYMEKPPYLPSSGASGPQFREEYIDGCEGIIFFSYVSPDIIEVVRRKGVPFVLCSSGCMYRDVTQIYLDMYDTVRQPFEKLYELGHRRIAIISQNPRGHVSGAANAMIYTELHRFYGLDFREEYLRFDSSPDDNLSNFQKLMALPEPPTAIMGANSIAYAKGLGLKVPEDLSMISIGIAGMLNSEISSCFTDFNMMGRITVEELFAVMSDPVRLPRHTMVPINYHERGTCAPPKNR